MHNFVVHSNESACEKSGRLGLHRVFCLAENVSPASICYHYLTMEAENKIIFVQLAGFSISCKHIMAVF